LGVLELLLIDFSLRVATNKAAPGVNTDAEGSAGQLFPLSPMARPVLGDRLRLRPTRLAREGHLSSGHEGLRYGLRKGHRSGSGLRNELLIVLHNGCTKLEWLAPTRACVNSLHDELLSSHHLDRKSVRPTGRLGIYWSRIDTDNSPQLDYLAVFCTRPNGDDDYLANFLDGLLVVDRRTKLEVLAPACV
jgi:hypothetical protein